MAEAKQQPADDVAKDDVAKPADDVATRSRRRRILLVACAAFFLRFAALGAFLPYQSLWLADVGHHDATTLGVVLALSRAASFVSPMCVGGIADAYMRHREVYIVCVVTSSLAVFAATLMPEYAWWQALMFMVASAFEGGALLDAMVTRSLAWAGATDLAPRSRAFGAISWCAMAPIYGALQKSFGIATVFRIYSLLALLALPVCIALPIRQAYAEHTTTTTTSSSKAAKSAATSTTSTTSEVEMAENAAPASTDGEAPGAAPPAEQPQQKQRFLSRVRLVVKRPETCLRLFLIFMTGLHFGIAFTFGFLFLEHELHASGAQLGLSLTAQALLEVPLFQVAAPLIRRMGKVTALLSCTLAAAFRFLGYITMPSVWWVLPFEMGHGFSFAIVYTSLALLGEEYASIGLQATVQGLGNSAQQLGSFSAVLIWSTIIGGHGLRFAFTVAAIIFGVASAPIFGSIVVALYHTLRQCSMLARTGRPLRAVKSPPRMLEANASRSDDVAHTSPS